MYLLLNLWRHMALGVGEVSREMHQFSPAVAEREELELRWRLQLEEAHARYQFARAQYRRLLSAKPQGDPTGEQSPLALAREAESVALAEYRRLLKIFTDLTVDGRIPQDQSTERANGASM